MAIRDPLDEEDYTPREESPPSPAGDSPFATYGFRPGGKKRRLQQATYGRANLILGGKAAGATAQISGPTTINWRDPREQRGR